MDMSEVSKREYRERRVKRIKHFILGIVCVLLIIPIFTCAYLMTRVVELDEKIDLFQRQLLTYIEHNSTKVLDIEQVALENELLETGTIRWEIDLMENGVPTTGKQVYLTFDDGPSYYTNDILDILEEYNVLATFFVVGNKNQQMDDLYVRIVEDGHELAVHSYTHDYSQIYASTDALLLDIQLTQEKLIRLTGSESKIYRFPGGSSNSYIKNYVEEYITLINELGLIYYDWNVSVVEPSWNSSTTAQELANTVVQDILKNNQSIVLMHDDYYKPLTIQALPFIIEQLQEEDIEILPITESTNPVKHVVDTREE